MDTQRKSKHAQLLDIYHPIEGRGTRYPAAADKSPNKEHDHGHPTEPHHRCRA